MINLKKKSIICFQVFFLVITFGLYHGLVFFPVLLSLIGPSAYQHSEDDHQISAKKGHSKQATTLWNYTLQQLLFLFKT